MPKKKRYLLFKVVSFLMAFAIIAISSPTCHILVGEPKLPKHMKK